MKINPYAVPALLTPAQVSESIGLGVHVLQNWRNTDIGPPYTKLTTGPQGRVRYRLEDVLEWQKECWRVVPDGWEPIGEFPGESAPNRDRSNRMVTSGSSCDRDWDSDSNSDSLV
jgi:hypothetical protein